MPMDSALRDDEQAGVGGDASMAGTPPRCAPHRQHCDRFPRSPFVRSLLLLPPSLEHRPFPCVRECAGAVQQPLSLTSLSSNP